MSDGAEGHGNLLYGPQPDVAGAAGYPDAPPRMGFFTDTSVCIGCKACEVACKEWNAVPEDGLLLTGMSYDNTQGLGADTWRHVAFIEQRKPLAGQEPGVAHDDVDVFAAASRLGTGPASPGPGATAPPPDRAAEGAPAGEISPVSPDGRTELRWLMASDVCKHCTHAACLDVCPTGSLFRTEFGTVVVQEDICNGCGYCVPACPYGVIDQRKDDGRAWKCTLCYDRLGVGMEPACAKSCPTDSIQFGPLEELRERARARVAQLHAAGVTDARLYGESPDDGVGGDGAFFLLLDEPEVYGLPPDPVVTTRDLPDMWRHAALAAVSLVALAAGSFVRRQR
ncbi:MULTISPECIES: 4Fe-4S dicluster domain-containing protein [Streptomyces]|uniref:Ferredoxin n=2 Tax=Streptomyces TaxID=1883 RepID=A0A101QDG8_STRCK|nr:4Fe-4S dicluster domain-containing protein [Streptomyces corchorusii]AEY87285.1 4Fe-4S ferredoxin, iron-sulfur binding protein [Streptomyces hygroscopicus subsp. jinggangensis 5008]AGF61441.1 4Fe-4S ferredoxin, iron-sulfur binding protein [Streptomyces hygroscopicus subsp. jinggangensis TL01]KUN27931.1 ferredoxin [Streptomyces corchorusii]